MTQLRPAVLLVDDNPEDAELVVRTLRSVLPEVTVHRARDGAEALVMLEDWPRKELPRLILLDLKMPKVDGFEVLRVIGGDRSLRTIPVVVLTSSSMDGDVQLAYSLGAASYVVKPIDFEGFTEALQHVARYWLELNRVPGPQAVAERGA